MNAYTPPHAPSARPRPRPILTAYISALPTPDPSPAASPYTAPASQSAFAPCTPPRQRNLGGLPTPSHSSFGSSTKSSGRKQKPSLNTHRRAPSLRVPLTPTAVRPSTAMSSSPSTARPSITHSRRPSAATQANMGAEIERPASRSERLLREALARDDLQRSPLRRAQTSAVIHHSGLPNSKSHAAEFLADCCASDDDESDEDAEAGPSEPSVLFRRMEKPKLRRASRSANDAASVRSSSVDTDPIERTRAWVESSPLNRPAPLDLGLAAPLARRPSARRSTVPPSPGMHQRAASGALAHLHAISSQHPPSSPRAASMHNTLPSSPRRAIVPLSYDTRPPAPFHSSSLDSTSSSESSTPATPPLAAAFDGGRKFDVHGAARKLRMQDGYVSFAAVEGLGVPEEEGEVDGEGRRWWRLWA
ncbi:hypothetical protein PENSPDRAFT_649383 [Peniophora sp. CONT]|nr:hypothetical protein PENSPDRAFT_649383 [Peniophora sp. CONT]